MLNTPWLKVLRRPVESAQYDGDDWQRFCCAHQLQPSMTQLGSDISG